MSENQFNPGSVIQQSPGVATREIDLTNYVPFQGVSGGAFVGEFIWGPVEKDLTVSDTNYLLNYYGKPNDKNYLDWFSAYNFLSYTDNLKIIRVVTEAGSSGVDPVFAYNATAVPLMNDASGVLIKNEDHYRQFVADADISLDDYDEHQFAARYPGALGNSIRVSMADAKTYPNWEFRSLFDFAPGTSDSAPVGVENDEIHVVITDELGAFTGTKGAVLEKYAFLSKASDAKNLDNRPSFYGSVLNTASSYVWYLGPPSSTELTAEENSDAVASVTITNSGAGYTVAPTVTFTPPPGSGAEAVANLGTGSRSDQVVSVNPKLQGGVPVTGSGYTVAPVVVVTGGGAGVTETAVVEAVLGTGANTGKVVRYRVVNPGSGYTSAPTITVKVDVATAVAELGTDDDAGKVVSITITNPGSGYTSVPTISIAGDGTNAAATAVMVKKHMDAWDQTYIDNVNGRARSFRSLSSIYAKTLSGGSDGDRVSAKELVRGWSVLRDSENHDVSLLFTGSAGGLENMRAVNQFVIDNVAEYRGDCVVFISPALDDVVNKNPAIATQRVIERRNDLGRSSNYAVMDSGWKLQYDQFNDKYRWLPLNPDIAGLCASTDATNDPWWSPAGHTRGRIKNCISLAYNPNKTNRDELYKLGINPVTTFVGEGTILFGDKTLQNKPSAFSWINVRRLFIVLKKSIKNSAKYHLFDFNDRFTRSQFVNMVEPFLREVKGRRGITDFQVICDESNNPGEVIDRGEFVANILVKPNRSINYITLNMVAVKSSVDFDELLGSM